MKKVLIAMLFVSSVALVGCKKDQDTMKAEEPKTMSTDACSHCAGVQTATTDGKCPVCGMAVKK